MALLHFITSHMFLYADEMLFLHPLKSSSDIATLNQHLQNIHYWLSLNSLSINLLKSIVFSLHPQSYFDPLPPVKIAATSLQRVYTYKHLGLLFKPNLSRSQHIQEVKKKANKIIGLIYRHFNANCSSSTLLTLYKMLICPLLEYGSVIWDPTLPTLISFIESIQHRALKLVSKSWSTDYSSLLSKFRLSTLKHRRKIVKVTIIFNILHLLNSPLRSPPPLPYSLRHYDPHNYLPIICKTHSFSTSFYPTAIKLWNYLPSLIKSLVTPSLFKSKVKTITSTTNSN